jgi:hypothetical protein
MGCGASQQHDGVDPVAKAAPEPAPEPSKRAGEKKQSVVQFADSLDVPEEPKTEAKVEEKQMMDEQKKKMMEDVGHSFKKINKEMKEAFQKIDVDNSGSIDKEEFSQILEKFPSFFTKEDIDAMYAYADADGNGKITYSEFTEIYDELQEEIEEAKLKSKEVGAAEES